MKFPAIIFLIVLTTTSDWFLEQIKADNSLLCTPCDGPECDMTFGTCYFGTTRNFCGQQECKKGPNQTCGGLFDQRGRCGDGLNCRCGVCTGCSTDTLECYYRHCRPEQQDEAGPLSRPAVHYPFATLG